MRAATVALAVLLAGCAGTLEDPERFASVEDAGSSPAASCPDVPTQIFATTCATAGCHAANEPSAGLDLQSPGVYARLAGKRDANGGLLVDSVHPAQSTLYEKLKAPPPYGARMPDGKPPLDDATIACVLDWIGGGG